MFQMQSLSLSLNFNPMQHPRSFGSSAWPRTQIHGVNVNRSPNKNILFKPTNKICAPNALQDGYALQSEDAIPPPSTRLDFIKMKLNAISHLTRFYAQINNVVAVTSVCFLPLQCLPQVTPTFLMGVFKAIVPSVLISISICSLNQICDVEIDKINKPYLPLPSGDLSMPTGIAICVGSALLSVALGVMSGSPAVLWATILWGAIGAAYSIPLPFLRWKSNSFLAPFSMVIGMGPIVQTCFFVHSQKYLLGGSFTATRPFIFATTIMSVFAFVIALSKDLPDVEGDKAYEVRTLSVVLGKEKVFLLCINMMLLGYGGAVIAGAFASSTTSNKLVTMIGHSVLALWMWLRSQKVDLDKIESISVFYMFIWKLNYIEYFLIHFLR